jgi:hypothetical protein
VLGIDYTKGGESLRWRLIWAIGGSYGSSE